MCSSNSTFTQLSLWPLAWAATACTALVTTLRLARWPLTHSPFRTQPLRMHVENLKLRPHASHPLKEHSRTLYLVKRS